MGKKLRRIYTPTEDPQRPYRYVMYVRKSSEGEGAQEKSIPDQIKYCEEYAEREGLQVISTIKEAKSAKKSGNRPLFSKMLEAVSVGKYDGILSYHPDRLARNSLEGGMIVDMLDSKVIKDLKFPTLHFTNDASGKLLLNILFAMSKQYSEHLSESITRGVGTNFEQGKSSAHKWGYVRNEITHHYEPSPENFDLIKQGWEMRAEGITQNEIVDFWKKNNVHRMTKISRKNKKIRKITISKQIASNIFSDPFYFGILLQNDQEVDLNEITNFVPMISEEMYDAVQVLGRSRSKVPIYSQKKTFYPLRGLVYCGVCNSSDPMRVGKNRSGDGTHKLTYRCDNKMCTRKVKSVRARYIFDDLYEKLDRLKFTDKEYLQYSKKIDEYTEEKILELRTRRRSLEGELKHYKANIESKSRQYASLVDQKDTPASVLSTLNKDLENLQSSRVDIEGELEKITNKLNNSNAIKLSKEEFLNLTNSIADKMRAGTPVEKDIIARKLFLNIHLDDERAPSYLWKEPFATLLKSRVINSGADERT